MLELGSTDYWVLELGSTDPGLLTVLNGEKIISIQRTKRNKISKLNISTYVSFSSGNNLAAVLFNSAMCL